MTVTRAQGTRGIYNEGTRPVSLSHLGSLHHDQAAFLVGPLESLQYHIELTELHSLTSCDIMPSITVRGKEYDMNELTAEPVSFTNQLAQKARIDKPLPAGTDLSESEDKEFQTQVRTHNIVKVLPLIAKFNKLNAMTILPPEIIDSM